MLQKVAGDRKGADLSQGHSFPPPPSPQNPAAGRPVVSSRPARWRKKDGGKREGLLQTISRDRGAKRPLSTAPPVRRIAGPLPPRRSPLAAGRVHRRSSPPPVGVPPFHPGNRGATAARAWLGADGAGPGGAGAS